MQFHKKRNETKTQKTKKEKEEESRGINEMYSPRFSTEWLISRRVRVYLDIRLEGVCAFRLTPLLPAVVVCIDWLLFLRMVGRRATNDALCLKLEEALLWISLYTNYTDYTKIEIIKFRIIINLTIELLFIFNNRVIIIIIIIIPIWAFISYCF